MKKIFKRTFLNDDCYLISRNGIKENQIHVLVSFETENVVLISLKLNNRAAFICRRVYKRDERDIKELIFSSVESLLENALNSLTDDQSLKFIKEVIKSRENEVSLYDFHRNLWLS